MKERERYTPYRICYILSKITSVHAVGNLKFERNNLHCDTGQLTSAKGESQEDFPKNLAGSGNQISLLAGTLNRGCKRFLNLKAELSTTMETGKVWFEE